MHIWQVATVFYTTCWLMYNKCKCDFHFCNIHTQSHTHARTHIHTPNTHTHPPTYTRAHACTHARTLAHTHTPLCVYTRLVVIIITITQRKYGYNAAYVRGGYTVPAPTCLHRCGRNIRQMKRCRSSAQNVLPVIVIRRYVLSKQTHRC